MYGSKVKSLFVSPCFFIFALKNTYQCWGLVCFFAARYQNELAGVDAEQLAERFYHQAWSVMPHVGQLLLPIIKFCSLVFQ